MRQPPPLPGPRARNRSRKAESVRNTAEPEPLGTKAPRHEPGLDFPNLKPRISGSPTSCAPIRLDNSESLPQRSAQRISAENPGRLEPTTTKSSSLLGPEWPHSRINVQSWAPSEPHPRQMSVFEASRTSAERIPHSNSGATRPSPARPGPSIVYNAVPALSAWGRYTSTTGHLPLLNVEKRAAPSHRTVSKKKRHDPDASSNSRPRSGSRRLRKTGPPSLTPDSRNPRNSAHDFSLRSSPEDLDPVSPPAFRTTTCGQPPATELLRHRVAPMPTKGLSQVPQLPPGPSRRPSRGPDLAGRPCQRSQALLGEDRSRADRIRKSNGGPRSKPPFTSPTILRHAMTYNADRRKARPKNPDAPPACPSIEAAFGRPGPNEKRAGRCGIRHLTNPLRQVSREFAQPCRGCSSPRSRPTRASAATSFRQLAGKNPVDAETASRTTARCEQHPARVPSGRRTSCRAVNRAPNGEYIEINATPEATRKLQPFRRPPELQPAVRENSAAARTPSCHPDQRDPRVPSLMDALTLPQEKWPETFP